MGIIFSLNLFDFIILIIKQFHKKMSKDDSYIFLYDSHECI